MDPSTRSSRRTLRRLLPAAACVIGLAGIASPAMAAPGMLTAPGQDAAANRASIEAKLAPIPLEGKAGAPIPIAGGGAAPGLAAFGDFAGAPGGFATPLGGRAITMPIPERPGDFEVTLTRADGSVYAKATRNTKGGFYDEVTYYGEDDKPVVSMSAEHLAKKKALKGAPKPKHAAPKGKTHRETAYCDPAINYSAKGKFLYAGTMGFYIHTGIPANWVNPILYAADNWNSAQNHCNLPDQSAVNIYYAGATSTTLGNNGVNTVDYADVQILGGVCADPAAIACNLTWYNGVYASDSDNRFDSAPQWFINGQAPNPGKADVEGTITHEFGHSLGLDHASSDAEVMSAVLHGGDESDRKLGRGETAWMNATY